MNSPELERFREVEEIFYAAIEQPPGAERDTLITERCGADENLRSEVAHLLEEHETIRAAVPAPDRQLPRFGAWQAVKLLGRGGMGTVYLAERADGAFEMSAAVKVVPLALASPEIEDRFRRERQFLASLDHPKVARLIDGGVSEAGLPYLVMEFVSGLTIERFCDAHQLDTRARIALVRQVLDALAYVHGRHVIHRDVKPSNILVDEPGRVKLLDFGTARLMDATAEGALTKTGVFAFTPDYASPEQLRGEPAGAASDLYSAGVLLYRLLTGRLPYRMSDLSPAGVASVIGHAEPEPPRLDAPLDAILWKALSKHAAGRYQSAEEMDADLQRYLEGQPVRARQPRRKLWSALVVALVAAAAALWGFRIVLAPRSARQLVPFEAGIPNAMQPALSHDGKWLAFAAPGEAGSRPNAWLKPMPHGTPQRVTSGEAANDEPALSPDGKWLAFHSTRQPPGIYLQPAAGGPAHLLLAGGRLPRFSPDGRWIAYLNTSEIGGDILAPNTRMLYLVAAQGGDPVRLARSASSVQGAAWSNDSRSVLFLAPDELSSLRLWSAPLDGRAAASIPAFHAPTGHLDSRACALTGGRFLYTATNGAVHALSEFPLDPALGARPYSFTDPPSPWEVLGCTASADGAVLVDAAEDDSSAWVLPIDAESGVVHGPLKPLTEVKRGGSPVRVNLTPDGLSFLLLPADGPGFLQDDRTGAQRQLPGAVVLSADGLFVLHAVQAFSANTPSIANVVNLRTGQSWGRMESMGMYWDLSPAGLWVLSATPALSLSRTIVAWDTRSAEHRVIYANPRANLYLANFSQDGNWVLFTSEEGGGQPHMWAAPFRGLQSVPATEWVDLGEGDYPRWSPAARRIYFTGLHDGFECLFTRAVDPATKRPIGPVTEVQHFHGRLTPLGLRPGTFRISVAQEKIALTLGERVHRLMQWK